MSLRVRLCESWLHVVEWRERCQFFLCRTVKFGLDAGGGLCVGLSVCVEWAVPTEPHERIHTHTFTLGWSEEWEFATMSASLRLYLFAVQLDSLDQWLCTTFKHSLKGKFTQKYKFSHYLLYLVPIKKQVKIWHFFLTVKVDGDLF